MTRAGRCAHTGGSAGRRSAIAVAFRGVEAGASTTGKCRVAQRAVPGFGAGKKRDDATPMNFCSNPQRGLLAVLDLCVKSLK